MFSSRQGYCSSHLVLLSPLSPLVPLPLPGHAADPIADHLEPLIYLLEEIVVPLGVPLLLPPPLECG